MYINLILGLAVICAVVWLVRSIRKPKTNPGEILRDEIARRRASQEEKRLRQERLKALRRGQLARISGGLADMREAMRSLPIRWLEQEDGIELVLEYRREAEPAEEKFILRWDIKKMDLALLPAYERSPEFYGEYVLQWPDGSVVCEAELDSFMRRLSALIADKLAS
jgi:hypothetical protein